MPLVVQTIQVGLPPAPSPTAGTGAEFEWEEEVGNSLVVREPSGVVGAITPWNYPLYQIALKVAPALAAGCTVVLKPSEVAPLNAFILAEVIDEVGLPPGVFNLVTGVGPVVGEAMAGHPKVDMVSFTGSTRAGKRVMQLAAEKVKKVALELGGKSANVILDDADLDTGHPGGRLRRLPELRADLLGSDPHGGPPVPAGRDRGTGRPGRRGLHPGDPFEAATRLGPLVSAAQRDRVRTYIERGRGGGHAAHRRGRSPRGPATRASSSGRPSSPT